MNTGIEKPAGAEWIYRERVAYHEAGHAVVAFVQGIEAAVVSIIRDPGRSLGHCTFPPVRAGEFPNRALANIAGPISEVMACGGESVAHDDVVRAHKLFPDMKHNTHAAKGLLDDHWCSVQRVAAALQDHEVVLTEELRTLVRPQSDLVRRMVEEEPAT